MTDEMPAPEGAQTTEPTPAPETTPEPPRHRLIGRETRRFEFPLTLEERARIGDRVGNLGRRLRELEREHDAETERAKARIAAAKSEASEEASKRRTEIAEAAADFDNALEAQTTGVERRSVEVERRAVLATSTIEVVRVDTGEVVETRPMQEPEVARYVRQGTIEDVTGGATVKAGVEPAEGEEAPEDDDEADSDALDEEEAARLKRPVGWPRSWGGKSWTVKGEPLDEADVYEVYLRLTSAGVSLDTLCDGNGAVQGLEASGMMSRALVGRALSLLRGKGLADRGEGKGVWVLVDRTSAPEEPEPGRHDPLPEAGDAKRPKRQGKTRTKADALVNDAAEQSDGWGL